MTYAQFSRKLGVSPSTLHRIESGEQSATLKLLQQVLSRLKVDLRAIFPIRRAFNDFDELIPKTIVILYEYDRNRFFHIK